MTLNAGFSLEDIPNLVTPTRSEAVESQLDEIIKAIRFDPKGLEERAKRLRAVSDDHWNTVEEMLAERIALIATFEPDCSGRGQLFKHLRTVISLQSAAKAFSGQGFTLVRKGVKGEMSYAVMVSLADFYVLNPPEEDYTSNAGGAEPTRRAGLKVESLA